MAPAPAQHLADYLGQIIAVVIMIKWRGSGFQAG